MEGFNELLKASEPIQKFVYALILSGATSWLIWIFRARVSLIWGSTSKNLHSFNVFNEKNQALPISVWTEKFYVQNIGRKPALLVEIVLSAPPNSYNIWSPREHSVSLLPNGNFVIKVPAVAPRELVIVDIIDLDLKRISILSVNCPEALSRTVEFQVTRKFNLMFNVVIFGLLISGMVGVAYGAITAIGVLL